MRRSRLKVEGGVGYYHCVSRVVDRRHVFGEVEKAHFVGLMREYEAFCGVRVLTHCVMGNHFHVLVEVPERPERLPSGEEVVRKLRGLTGHPEAGLVEGQLGMFRSLGDEAGERAYLERFYGRMWDVSVFMKLLKQRFSQWYNGRNGRKGTLWEERFRSVLVEGAGQALGAVAAYIDLNPVRAGLVKDPKDYRWSGYGEAVAGRRRAREGVQVVVKWLQHGQEEGLGRSLEVYRMQVYRAGNEERDGVGEVGRRLRVGLKREEVLKVLAANGRLGLMDYVKCRVRYFSDGLVLGSREFVERVFWLKRGWFGAGRKEGARRMRGLEGAALYTMRDLRRNVFG